MQHMVMFDTSPADTSLEYDPGDVVFLSQDTNFDNRHNEAIWPSLILLLQM
jgi:hypothetical protein